MPDFLLDTQTIRYWFDESSPFHQTVRETAAALPPGSHVCISVITLGEIEYGIAFNPVGMGGRLDEYRRFVRDKLPRIVPVSRHTSEPYGRVRALLTERFPPPGGWSKKKRAEQLYDPLVAAVENKVPAACEGAWPPRTYASKRTLPSFAKSPRSSRRTSRPFTAGS